jgi:hypothetical protein
VLIRRPLTVPDHHIRAQGITLAGHGTDGRPTWMLRAQAGSLDELSGAVESVELTIHRSPETRIVVTSDRLSRDSAVSTLSGAVRVEQDDVFSLRTETMVWDERNGVLESGAVAVETASASIGAETFRHDLAAGLTTLTRNIEAQLTQDGKAYTIRSSRAELAADRLILTGDVSVQCEDGDQYLCQDLEFLEAQSAIHLAGGVSGTWQRSAFSADELRLDNEGIQLRGQVTIDLELLMIESPHDT